MAQDHIASPASFEDSAKVATQSLQAAMEHVIDRAEAAVARASDAAAKMGDGAKVNIAGASERAQKAVDDVSPYLRRRPYLVVGLAALCGLVMGLLVAPPRPRADGARET